MPDTKEIPKQELHSFEWKSNPTAPNIYGNYFHIGWTLDDVRMVFGLLKAEGVVSREFHAEEQGTVILAWRQAKNFRDLLSRIIDAHEEANGPIPTPFLADPNKKNPDE